LLEFGLFGTGVFVMPGFVDAGHRRVCVEVLREVGSPGFHDVDPLYVARLRGEYASVQAIDMPCASGLSFSATQGGFASAIGSFVTQTAARGRAVGTTLVARRRQQMPTLLQPVDNRHKTLSLPHDSAGVIDTGRRRALQLRFSLP
jgi:hypothetical protein